MATVMIDRYALRERRRQRHAHGLILGVVTVVMALFVCFVR